MPTETIIADDVLLKRPDARHCSFCNTDEYHVSILVAGPQVFICSGCLITASMIVITQAPEFNFLSKLNEAMTENEKLHAAAGTKTTPDSKGENT